MKKLLLLLSLSIALLNASAQFKDLFDFNGTNGNSPYGTIAISGGQMFGMTEMSDNIFSIDTNGGNFKNILIFNGTDGWDPYGSVILFKNKLFGMTQQGGTYNNGVVFSIDTNGTNYRTLLNFNGANGAGPYGNLTISGKMLFGMTYYAGNVYDSGVIFSIDTNGSNYKELHNFNGTEGSGPLGSLTLIGKQLFGMTSQGGTYDSGVIFSIDSNGNNYKVLLNFNGINGYLPYGQLLLVSKKLYGLAYGGIYDSGVVFRLDTNGANYKDLFNFNGANGKLLGSNSLTLSGNTLYGTANTGGANTYGDIFSIDTNGNNFTDLFDFNGVNGNVPTGVTIAGSALYGMTSGGGPAGPFGDGNIFKYNALGLSIDKLDIIKDKLQIYPNPSNGKFTIQWATHIEQWGIEIYNLLGEEVFSTNQPISAKYYSVDLSNQPSGMYILKINSENQILYNKVIINN